MKFAVIFVVFLSFLVLYIRIARGTDLICEKAFLTTGEIIELDGYLYEEHTVTTDDGYILTMHRIPNPDGIPILLMHGLLSSSVTWILLGPGKGLAYLLHDLGYDIWLGNNRGNRYSRDHDSLDPDSLINAAYWDFSFHEIGKYDIPAMIDHVIQETDYEKIHYVGHSQGCTSFFVMADLRHDYIEKIISAHNLAPVAFMEHAKSPLIKALSKMDDLEAYTLLGNREIGKSNLLLQLAGQVACNAIDLLDVCKNLFFLIFGLGSTQTTDEMIQCIIGHTPAGASTKQLMHYAQLQNSKNFNTYRKFLSSTTPYDLSKVTVPVVLYHSPNDYTNEPIDVERLYEALPKVYRNKFLISEPTYNHMDFVSGYNNTELLYNEVIKNILRFE